MLSSGRFSQKCANGEIDINKKETIKLLSPIVIVGMGKSGKAALELLLALNYPRKEIICLDEGREKADYKDSATLLKAIKPATLVVSPGVPLSKGWIEEQKQRGCVITSEINIAASILQEEKIIGVTGSLGKSTVSALLKEGLDKIGEKCFIGGNFGEPLASYALKKLKEKKAVKWIILELSSFQLENCKDLSCDISLITHLTSNHLDRYKSLGDYYNTKLNILNCTKQKTFALAPGEDLYKHAQKVSLDKKIDWINEDKLNLSKEELAKIKMLGEQAKKNISLAIHIGNFYEWNSEFKRAILSFSGLAHRLENLGEKNGVLFVNDSKSTNISSVTAAVITLSNMNRKKVWLLLGGLDKNLPWHTLKLPKGNIKIIFFGKDGEKIKKLSSMDGLSYKTLCAALEALPSLYERGDAVLLSPGGSSLDEFKNFEERGNFFREKVKLY